jgi:hypothetical protein
MYVLSSQVLQQMAEDECDMSLLDGRYDRAAFVLRSANEWLTSQSVAVAVMFTSVVATAADASTVWAYWLPQFDMHAFAGLIAKHWEERTTNALELFHNDFAIVLATLPPFRGIRSDRGTGPSRCYSIDVVAHADYGRRGHGKRLVHAVVLELLARGEVYAVQAHLANATDPRMNSILRNVPGCNDHAEGHMHTLTLMQAVAEEVSDSPACERPKQRQRRATTTTTKTRTTETCTPTVATGVKRADVDWHTASTDNMPLVHPKQDPVEIIGGVPNPGASSHDQYTVDLLGHALAQITRATGCEPSTRHPLDSVSTPYNMCMP